MTTIVKVDADNCISLICFHFVSFDCQSFWMCFLLLILPYKHHGFSRFDRSRFFIFPVSRTHSTRFICKMITPE